jgi:hypothetical protein
MFSQPDLGKNLKTEAAIDVQIAATFEEKEPIRFRTSLTHQRQWTSIRTFPEWNEHILIN